MMNRLILGSIFLFVFTLAQALPLDPANNQKITALVNEALPPDTHNPNCSVPRSPNLAQPNQQKCRSRYKQIYAKPIVNITCAFGYLDSRPTRVVKTNLFAADFIETMTTSCGKENKFSNFCGFDRAADNANVFSKVVMGPDGKNHTVRVNVISPVLSDEEDAKNIDEGARNTNDNDDELKNSQEQKKRSATAMQAYLNALKTDDIVLYLGHSRNGGGPDFFSPRTITKGPLAGHLDYAYYRENRPGLTAMTDALKNSKHHPAVIGMLACDSKLHFSDSEWEWKKVGSKKVKVKKVGLKEAAPDSARLLTNMVLDTDSSEKAERAFLDGILAQRCDDGFVQSMETTKDLVVGHPEKGQAPAYDLEDFGVKTPHVKPAQSGFLGD